jgi:hypothetical protein
MSRKTMKKSDVVSKNDNPQVGIFTDKNKRTVTYNRLILQILLTESLEARPLAKKIKEIMNPKQIKETKLEKRDRIQKIYSVIQRKNKGRLDDLKSKGYIVDENGKWSLTKKGLIALSVENLEIVTKEIQAQNNNIIARLKERVEEMPNEMREPLGVKVDITEAKPRLARIDPSKVLIIMLEEARALISKGIDLDRISEEDLEDLVRARRSFLEKVIKLVIEE